MLPPRCSPLGAGGCLHVGQSLWDVWIYKIQNSDFPRKAVSSSSCWVGGPTLQPRRDRGGVSNVLLRVCRSKKPG